MRRLVKVAILATALLAAAIVIVLLLQSGKGPVPQPELRFVARTETQLEFDVQITREMSEIWALRQVKSSCTCVATAIHRPPLKDGQGAATVARLEVLLGSSDEMAGLFWRKRDRSSLTRTEIEVSGVEHGAAMIAEPWSARLGIDDEVSIGRVFLIGPSDAEPPILEAEQAGPFDVQFGEVRYDAEQRRWAADVEIRLANLEDRAIGTHQVLIRWRNADTREAVQLEVEVTG